MTTAFTDGIPTDKGLGPPPPPARPRRAARTFARLPTARAALRFARARHAGQHREIDHAAFIVHPLEVGRLLCDDRQPDEIVAAGLLLDILEKAATTAAELHRRFGARIAQVVESVSDDPSLGDYRSRKRDLRRRVAHGDADTRAVFAADKIAKARELAQLPPSQLNRPENRAKLAHYRASLDTLRRSDGDTPLIHRLDAELGRFVAASSSTRPRRVERPTREQARRRATIRRNA